MKFDFPDYEEIERAPQGELAVDALGLAYGRQALASGAAAGRRSAHFHRMDLGAPERDARLRRALEDAIKACRIIQKRANLSPAARDAAALERSALARLHALPVVQPRGRGSPGRVVHAAVAQSVAEVWSAAERRRIPRTGKVNGNHPLKALLSAVSEDLFGSRGELSVSLLRIPKK